MHSQNSSFETPKEAQEKMLRNSNILKQKGDQQKSNCPKHPNKKAKYYTETDRSQLFCSKCALSMALMGLKIEETPSEEEFQRKQRIVTFTSQLSQLVQNCDLKELSLIELTNTLKSNYNIQRDRCTMYFDQMILKLSQLKQQYLSKLSSTYSTSLSDTQQQLTTLKSSEVQLKQFLVDIERNHENIVKRMEMKPFTEIMDRYDSKVLVHQKIVEALTSPPNQTEMRDLNKDLIEQEITNFCERLLNFKEETEDVYQSTCSNSLLRTHSNIKLNTKLTQSPMHLPPFPKSSQNQNQVVSHKDSGANTPDSSKGPRRTISQDEGPSTQKTLVKVPNSADEINSDRKDTSPRKNSSHDQSLGSMTLQLKLGLQQIREEQKQHKTPTHLKQQSYQPISYVQPQTSLNSSNCKNSSAKKLPLWSESNQLMRNKQLSLAEPQDLRFKGQEKNSSKRSLSKTDKSEGKRNFILPQDQEESLKDRIFRELSGGVPQQESIYNQVLKINQKKSQRFIQHKENLLQSDWGSTSLKKTSYLDKK